MYMTCHAEEPELPKIDIVHQYGSSGVRVSFSTSAEIVPPPQVQLVGEVSDEGLFIGSEILSPLHEAKVQS